MESHKVLFNVAFWEITVSHSCEWERERPGDIKERAAKSNCRQVNHMWSFPLLELTTSTGLPSK